MMLLVLLMPQGKDRFGNGNLHRLVAFQRSSQSLVLLSLPIPFSHSRSFSTREGYDLFVFLCHVRDVIVRLRRSVLAPYPAVPV